MDIFAVRLKEQRLEKDSNKNNLPMPSTRLTTVFIRGKKGEVSRLSNKFANFVKR